MQICVQFHFKSEFIGTIKENKKKETMISMLFMSSEKNTIIVSEKGDKVSTVLVLFISIDEF